MDILELLTNVFFWSSSAICLVGGGHNELLMVEYK